MKLNLGGGIYDTSEAWETHQKASKLYLEYGLCNFVLTENTNSFWLLCPFELSRKLRPNPTLFFSLILCARLLFGLLQFVRFLLFFSSKYEFPVIIPCGIEVIGIIWVVYLFIKKNALICFMGFNEIELLILLLKIY